MFYLPARNILRLVKRFNLLNSLKMIYARVFSFRFLRFAFIGGLSSAIYAIVVWTLLNYQWLDAFFASVIGYCAAMPFNFVGQKRFTFRSTGNANLELLGFIPVQLFNILLSGVIMKVSVDYLMWPSFIGIVLVVAVIPLTTYFLLKFLVFATSKSH